jgi:hypothetical protein
VRRSLLIASENEQLLKFVWRGLAAEGSKVVVNEVAQGIQFPASD